MVASVIGFGLLLAPAALTDRIRAVVRDAAFPGLRVVDVAYQRTLTIPERFQRSQQDDDPNETVLAERDVWEHRFRQVQAVNAQLARQLELARSGHGSPFLAEPGTPLFVPELVAARVIGAEELDHATRRVSYRRLVDMGTGRDVIPSDFVVSQVPATAGDAPPLMALIDQGDDSGLHADEAVFAGRCVVGKVGQVGRWTSTVIPVTDVAFRGRGQLVRSAPQGLVLGPEGVISGNGERGCLLKHIPSTEPVAVGDEVYTSLRLTGLPVPMYYGKVVKATLPEGAPHWEIVVEPAETIEATRVVHVLRSVLNAARTGPDPDRGTVRGSAAEIP